MSTVEEMLGGFTYAWICNSCKTRECIHRTNVAEDKPKRCVEPVPYFESRWKRAATGLLK